MLYQTSMVVPDKITVTLRLEDAAMIRLINLNADKILRMRHGPFNQESARVLHFETSGNMQIRVIAESSIYYNTPGKFHLT